MAAKKDLSVRDGTFGPQWVRMGTHTIEWLTLINIRLKFFTYKIIYNTGPVIRGSEFLNPFIYEAENHIKNDKK